MSETDTLKTLGKVFWHAHTKKYGMYTCTGMSGVRSYLNREHNDIYTGGITFPENIFPTIGGGQLALTLVELVPSAYVQHWDELRFLLALR